MAENEVLDVGNHRRYRRWRHALADASVDPASVADCLSEEFLTILGSELRRRPLYLVFKACGQDRNALQEAVISFKNREMAKFVERAYAISGSNIPLVVASKIAELLVDRLVDRASRYALKHDRDANGGRHSALEQAAVARLEACKPEIVRLLAASLRNEPIRRPRGAGKPRITAQTLNSISLLPKEREEKRTTKPRNGV